MSHLRFVLCLLLLNLVSCMDMHVAQLATVVQDDNSPKTISVEGPFLKNEGDSFQLTLRLSGQSSQPVTLQYETSEQSGLSVFDRAEMSQDFSQARGSLTFSPGELVKVLVINTINDAMSEKTKKFDLSFTNLSGASMSSLTYELSIVDTDSALMGADVERILQFAGPDQMPRYEFKSVSTLYVDKSGGSDANSGSSENNAFSSIQRAVDVAQAGTLILVKNGLYQEQVIFPRSGTSTLPIQVRAYSGHSPVVSGAEVAPAIAQVADSPEETSDLFSSGFESGAIDSAFSLSRPVANEDTSVEAFSGAPQSMHGLYSALFKFTNSQAANKGVNLKWDNGASTYAALFVRFYISLDSAFAFAETAKRVDVGMLQNGSTTHARIVLKKDGSNNRFYVQVLSSTNAVCFDSSTAGVYVAPGGGYAGIEVGYDATNVSAPIAVKINGIAQAVTNQPDPTGVVLSAVRFGFIHSSSTVVTYPTPGSLAYFDSIKISTQSPGDFLSVWPPQHVTGNDFESTLSPLGSVVGGGNSTGLSSLQKKFGTSSALLSFAGSSAISSLQHSIQKMDDVYVRFFFRLEDFDLNDLNSSVTDNTRRWNILTLGEGATSRVSVALVKTTQGLRLDARVLTPNVSNISNYYKGYPNEVRSGQWYQVEVRFRGNSATYGGSELWLNAKSIGGNYDRTPNPDVYYGLNTSGLRVDTVSLGDALGESTTYPTNGSKIFIDDYRVSTGAPSGVIPNTQNLAMYSFTFSSASYTGMTTSRPNILLVKNATFPEGKALEMVADKKVVSPGTFAVEGTRVYFRAPGDVDPNSMQIEYGVRDTIFRVADKEHIVVSGFNIRGANQPNKGAVYLAEGAQHNWVIENLIQGNAGAGVRLEGVISNDGLSVEKGAHYNNIIGNHFRDNLLPFGSGLRFDNSGHSLVEHNHFESEVGTNISTECFETTSCREYRIRRNIFSSAGESHIYIAKYATASEVYGNWMYGARSSSYHTMKQGVRGSSGGSGVHIARGSNNILVFNNLMYDLDTGGVTLRAKVSSNKVFNNTIAKVGVKGAGTGIDFAKDNNELGLDDTNSNGIPDGQEDVENNIAFNNILSLTYGSNRCVDLEGYDADISSNPVTPDTSNISDYNAFYRCARVSLFNSTTYLDAQFSSYVAATLSVAGLQRDANSFVVPAGQNLFQNSDADDYRLIAPLSGACTLGTNCPWSP